jgi:two-component system, NarL family, nitrate/nitrite response regulator NarL
MIRPNETSVYMNKPIRVVICTRQTLLREGLKALLAQGEPIEVAGEAVTTGEALTLLERLSPDVLLIEPLASDLSGSEATRLITDTYPGIKVLLLCVNADASVISGGLRAGASGYIGSFDRSTELKDAIFTACGQQTSRSHGTGARG